MDILKELLDIKPRKNETQKIKMLGLSKRAGKDMVFTVRELSYNEIRNIINMEKGNPNGDVTLQVVLAGIVEPNLKSEQLLEAYNAPTPAELLPKILSAGEISDLSDAIDKLSGYRQNTIEIIEEIKKN